MAFTRITADPARMGGVPCIRDLRMPVATIVGMVADGMSMADILRAYPDLEAEDVIEALRFAADAVRKREILRADKCEPDESVANRTVRMPVRSALT